MRPRKPRTSLGEPSLRAAEPPTLRALRASTRRSSRRDRRPAAIATAPVHGTTPALASTRPARSGIGFRASLYSKSTSTSTVRAGRATRFRYNRVLPSLQSHLPAGSLPPAIRHTACACACMRTALLPHRVRPRGGVPSPTLSGRGRARMRIRYSKQASVTVCPCPMWYHVHAESPGLPP